MVGSVRDVESRNSKPNRTKMRGWSEGIHKGVVREKTAVCNCRSGAGLCGRRPGTGRGPGLYRSDRARELRGRRRDGGRGRQRRPRRFGLSFVQARLRPVLAEDPDVKATRLNSSHLDTSYEVTCLKYSN